MLAQSGHPRHTIRGIPVCQFKQVKHICSDELCFEQEAMSLYNRFLDWGYPRWIMDRVLSIARWMSKGEVLRKIDNYSRNKNSPSPYFTATGLVKLG